MSSDEEVVSVRKKKYMVESDGDENEIDQESFNINKLTDTVQNDNYAFNEDVTKKKNKCRRIQSFDSDSDSEIEENSPHNVNFIHSEKSTKVDNFDNPPKKLENNTDSSEEDVLLQSLYKKKEIATKNSWYKNSDLFEDESSEEESISLKERKHSEDEDPEMKNNVSRPPSPAPDSPRKERQSKKKAEKEIQEIHKESQRMMRQARVSIPYHRPRQHTLAEFRERRKATPVVSLHTSIEQLTTAWKAIEQREKEAEAFYKSETSDDESQGEEEKENTSNNVRDKLENSKSSADKNVFTNQSSNDNNLNSVGILENDSTKLEKTINNCGENSSDSVGGEVKIVSNIESVSSEELLHIQDNVIANEKQDFIEPISLDKNTESEQIQNTEDQNTEHIEYSQTTENKSLPKVDKQPLNDVVGLEDDKSDDKSSTDCLQSTSNGTNIKVDSEEFSLRLSESQSDLQSSSALDYNDCNNEVFVPKSTSGVCETGTNKVGGVADTKMEIDHYASHCSKTLADDSIERQEASAVPVNDDEVECDSLKNVGSSKDKETQFENTVSLKDSITLDCTFVKNISNCNDPCEEDECIEAKLRDKYNFEPSKTVTEGPRITGSHDEFIDLDEKVVKPGVNGLIERFYTHLSYKNKPAKKKTPLELSIVSTETDDSGHVSAVNKEIVKVLVGEDEEEEDPSLAKPGAKLARLRAHLEAEMGRHREQEWSRKQQEQRLYEDEIYEGEKDVCDGDDEVDENEDDQESSEESEEEEEEEIEEENDEPREKSKKSEFFDDEAEESDDGDDNCAERDEDDYFIKRPTHKKVILKRTQTADMFLSQELLKSNHTEEEELTSFQKPLTLKEKPEELLESESPVCPSPAFQLTALEGKNMTYNWNWSEPTTPRKEFVSAKTVTPVRLPQLVQRSPHVGSQDLENLFSGQFVSQPAQDIEENNSQDFQLFLNEDSQLSEDQTPLKTLETSQTKTPDLKEQMRKLLVDDVDDKPASGVNKKVKKLNFSDDEEDDDGTQQLEGNSEDSEVEEDELEGTDNQAEDVAYDSEENEIVKNAKDFLEKEAELSDSEWSSEDEDEHGLDTLEMEEADKEKIDQRKLKQQLDQIHMRQMLIEDKKEVRLLQEMLLEDGELHSEGKRQRLFRWSNNAFGAEDNKAQIDSDDDKPDEDEDDENWRISRHEREVFLQEHNKKHEKVELAVEEQSDSQLLKLGQRALKRMSSNSQEPKLTPPVDPLASPDKPFKLLMKRGSFLTRGQQVLSRLAQMVATNTDGPINQPKNSRNFVFTSVSPTKNKEEEVRPELPKNKRKIPVLPLPIPKRPCVQKTKTANKRSLFEALSKVQS